MKYEWKKHEKALYLPKAVPAPVTVPEHAFFMIRGEGNPNGEAFLEAIGVLYALSYAVKMLPKKGDAPEGYYEYAVFPLEGVWDTAEPMLPGEALNKDALRYTLMIRQPDFVTDELAERILAATSRKKTASPLCVGLFRALERWLVCANASRRPLRRRTRKL